MSVSDQSPTTSVPKSITNPAPLHKHDGTLYVLYFIGRYLVVLTSYFLCIISLLYAIGNLVKLEALNFFCPRYTEEEVRAYNFEVQAKDGTDGFSCYHIDRQKLNFQEIYQATSNIYSAKIEPIGVINVILCASYLILCLHSSKSVMSEALQLRQIYVT